MFIKFHIKREFFYFLFFIPLSLIIQGLLYFLSKFQFIISIIDSLSMCSLIIFYLYEIIIFKKKNKNENQIFISKKNSCNILIISYIIFNLNNLYLFKFTKKLKEHKDIFNINIFLLIDLVFFKKYIYSHYILSNVIVIILSILYFFNSLEIFNSIINVFGIILESYCYCFQYFIIHYLNKNYFINIYLMGSIIGLSELIYYLSLRDKESQNLSFPFLLFVFIFKFFYHFLFFLIIYKIDTIHAFISYSLSSVLFKSMFINDLPNYQILFFIFSFMIYLEIIEIQCFGLNKNIKNNIIERSNQEIIILLQDISS